MHDQRGIAMMPCDLLKDYDAQINYPTFSQINFPVHSQLSLLLEELTRFRAEMWSVMTSETKPEFTTRDSVGV